MAATAALAAGLASAWWVEQRLHAVIEPIEAVYRRQGQPTIFRVPSFLSPALDTPLTERGYGREGETCVLYGAMDAVAAAPDPEIELSAEPSPEWLAAMAEFQRGFGKKRRTYAAGARGMAESLGLHS